MIKALFMITILAFAAAQEDELDVLFAEDEELFDLGNYLDLSPQPGKNSKEFLFVKGLLEGLPFQHEVKVPDEIEKKETTRKHIDKIMTQIQNKTTNEEELANLSFKLRATLGVVYGGLAKNGHVPPKFGEAVKKLNKHRGQPGRWKVVIKHLNENMDKLTQNGKDVVAALKGGNYEEAGKKLAQMYAFAYFWDAPNSL